MRTAFSLLALLLLASAAHAQEARRVILTDGSVVVGTIEDENDDPLVLTLRNGIEQRIPQARIAEITDLIGGRYTRLDPNRSRLFITPTARSLGQGNGRVSTLFYIFPNLSYGVLDRVDVSAGTFFAFGDDTAFLLLNGNVKAELLRTDNISVAVGGNAFLPLGEDTEGAVGGTVYGLATFGNEITAGTIGIGTVYGGSLTNDDIGVEFADAVAVTLGAEHQISDSFKLIAEAAVPVADGIDGAVVFPGVRAFGDRFAIDLYGVVAIGDGDATGFAPIVNFSYNF